MPRPEKTVFISYRRKDISWALAVYQYLTSKKYDVFFDYTHIPSGDFEQIIVSNIKSRAHFVLILTPTSLDRCSEPGDWLRREIETAIDEKRNIIPLFFEGFNFSSSAVAEKLSGKLANVSRYNGIDIPSGYFPESMERLRTRYLSVPLDAVLHPVSTQVRKKNKEEKLAANKALREKKEDIQELVKPIKEKPDKPKQILAKNATESSSTNKKWAGLRFKKTNTRSFVLGAGILIFAVLGIFGANSLYQSITATLHPPTPTRAIPTPIATKIATKDGMTLLYVPAGKFEMGAETNPHDDDVPVHNVYLVSFWIDQTEVTNAMYAKCVGAGECNEPSSISSELRDNYYGTPEFANYPVIYVSWNDAATYCSWSGRRLPTEAEWEKAARGESIIEALYPWGRGGTTHVANYNSDVFDTTAVGKYPNGASPYGALDMAGNVLEWVNDWYDPTHYQSSPSSNPQGPSSGQVRVLRGGSWRSSYISIRTTYRQNSDPTDTENYIGFRCASSGSE